MSVIIEQPLDYTQKVSNHPSYRANRLVPLGNASANLAVSSTVQTQIEIPTSVFNLSRSHLNFKVTIPADTGKCITTHAQPASFVDRIRLSSLGGVDIADLSHARQYCALANQCVTKLSDFLTYDDSIPANTEALWISGDKGKGHGFYRSNAALNAVVPAANARNGVRIVSGAEASADVAFTEQAYISEGGDGVAQFMNISLPMSVFANTFMSLDKDVYFGQNLLLTIDWSPINTLGFVHADTSVWTDAAALATSVVLSELRLELAVETNPLVAQSLVQKVQKEGMQMMIPYVYSNLQNTGGSSTSSSVQLRFNRTYGQRLLHVISGVFNGTTTGLTAFDHDNLTDKKVSSFQTSLDSAYLQQNPMDCSNAEDWDIIKPLLKDSVIGQSGNIYKYNHVWVDSWRAGPAIEFRERDAIVDGLSLDSEHVYQISRTTASGQYNLFTFAVCQRVLTITPQMVAVN